MLGTQLVQFGCDVFPQRGQCCDCFVLFVGESLRARRLGRSNQRFLFGREFRK
jgi:hypothetical protein